MANTVVVVRLEPGTPETGIWCNACMTSGGFALPILRLCPHGVQTVAIAAGCFTCEGPGDLDFEP